MDWWHELQQLSFEAKAGLVVAGLVPVAALFISEFRHWLNRKTDHEREDARERDEQSRREAQEQRDLRSKQAVFAFSRTNDKRLLGVGHMNDTRRLLGTLWNVGMADASLVNVKAFLNDEELPASGSWVSQHEIPVGRNLPLRFWLPFKVEPRGQEDNLRRDERLGESVARIEVRFGDGSAPDRMLAYCFRFERRPLPERWLSQQVDC